MGAPLHTALAHLDDYTVVRLADGRIGMKGHWTKRGMALVQFPDGSGIEVAKTDRVDVLQYPAQLARAYIEQFDGSETT